MSATGRVCRRCRCRGVVCTGRRAERNERDGHDAPREHEHIVVDEAVTVLAGVGNAYHQHALLCVAVTLAWRKGSDAEAIMFLERAVPLARRLPQPSRWLHMLDHVGLAALLRGDTAAADEAFREALTLSRELALGHQPVALAGLAAVAAVQDRPEPTARLAGAVAAHNSATDNAVQPRLEAGFLEPARLRCGPDAWDASARQGAALSLQQATIYALEQPPVHARRPPDTKPTPTAHAR
jgi:hypothetical protein